ncbi:MAG: hypothetical protein JWO67_3172 [Streptosporangiaceae bacterium]|nr:hypothetical protein [Streptosporangiaceae bacterium]
MTKVLRDFSCRIGNTCPRIEQNVEGSYDIVGTNVPDGELPGHERKIRVPATMLPELAGLDIPDFNAWLEQHRKAPGDILRVQTLDSYEVESDGGDFAAYVQGRPGPTSPDREPFFQQLRDERAKGMTWRDLTVVNGPLTDYQRYGFDWVCEDAVAAGQDIRILDVAAQPAAAVLLRLGDFWVVEGDHVVLVQYDGENRHLGEVAVEDQAKHGYVAAAEMAWQLATPFATWWATALETHPEYRRTQRAA